MIGRVKIENCIDWITRKLIKTVVMHVIYVLNLCVFL